MKKLKLAFAALLLTSTISFAQPATTQESKASGKHQHQNRMQDLNLTEDQKVQMKAENESFKTQLKALKSNGAQTDQQKEQRTALAQAHKAKVESILTTEQKSKMATLKATDKQNHPEMSDKHMQNMQKELNLTDAQANELKKNQATLKSKMDAIKNNSNLDEAAKHQQLSALKEERKAMFDKVLTAEQKEKFQGMRKEHKGKKHPGKKDKTPANV